MSKIVISAEKIRAGYNHRIVLDNITLHIPEGTFVGVIGPNGSGKSTLLKTIARLIEPKDGVIYIDGKNILELSRSELARKLAVVLTDRPSLRLMTVRDVVALGRYPYTDMLGRLKSEDLSKVDEVLRLVGIQHLADRFFSELSDGEKQKVLIARALAQEPRVLILDEPTTYLDIKHRVEIMYLLYRICKSRNIAVIASIHDIDLAAKFCDYIIVLKNGKIYRAGPPEEIFQEDLLREVYGLTLGVKSPLLSPELRVDPDERIFIVAGSGTGVSVYRAFARAGLGFYTGILYQNDIDYYIASAITEGVIAASSYEMPSREVIDLAFKLVNKARVVIDTGFPVGSLVKHNVELLIEANKRGKIVLSLRDRPIVGEKVKSIGILVDLAKKYIST